MQSSLNLARLRELLSYDPESGEITWVRAKGTRPAGHKAGTPNNGYLRVQVNRRIYPAHQIAWFLHFGEWPSHPIDHINGTGTDNRIVNLRLVTPSENQHNRRVSKNNKAGRLGVFYDKAVGRYKAEIAVCGVRHRLGTFSSIEAAGRAYDSAKRRLHPTSPQNRGGSDAA